MRVIRGRLPAEKGVDRPAVRSAKRDFSLRAECAADCGQPRRDFMNRSYHLIVDTPTLKKKRHNFVFNCDKNLCDGTLDKWLQEKLENYFWNAGSNKPTQFVVREYYSIVGELKEIKL